MPKLFAFILALILFSSAARAQTAQISGKVADTAENRNLANSSVLLLRKSDSIMVRHVRSNAAGEFKFTRVPGGHYLLLVTFPKYADYVDTLAVDSGADITLPVVGLILKSKLL